MSKPKVFVTQNIPQAGLDLLMKECEVFVNTEDRVLSKGEIMERLKGMDGMLCLLTDEIDGEIMDAEPNLKVISNYAVGFNNINVDEATKRGIPITNTPGVLTETTADFAWTLLMGIARRLVEADKFTRAGKFKGWRPRLLLGSDIYGKTIGIVGMGRIGQAMARRAKGFNMNILYYDEYRPDAKLEKELGITYAPFDELLQKSDYVSIHVPLMESTHHFIGERELKLMKKSAYLINSARGPIVDEKALVKALKEKEIAGAGLDVFEDEPELAPGLAELDNVVIAPHIASATVETRSKMATMAAEGCLSVLKGEKPVNLVNEDVWEKRRK
ncbi:MAG: 2-hydroxyacid dehydrogenase [Limnochordia bacterium]|jgi:glyoxylate reductase